MEFKRARSEEQFLFRKQEIINCAVKIYDESGYEGMNFSRISEITNFTRPTIYKYFATKEEIMLSLVLKYTDELIAYVDKEIQILEEISNESISNILTRAIQIVPNFMNCYSILYSVLEKNVSLDALVEFKKEWRARQITLRTHLTQLFPTLNDDEIHEFLVKYFSYASGLYPMCNKTQIQRDALRKAGIPDIQISFSNYFEPILLKLLEDLHD
ncbi:MAG: TetR family transcriptional regulator [Clostridia bacterium]